MKKTILVLLVAVLGTATVSAQFTKGSKTLSGKATGFDFSYTSWEGGYNRMNVDLGIAGSYFVADNIAITAELGLGSEKFKDEDGSTNFNFGVGARYYFLGGLYGGLGYVGRKYQDVDLLSYGKIEVGYDYYITDNVFFEPAVYFERGFSDLDKSNRFGLSIGIGVNF